MIKKFVLSFLIILCLVITYLCIKHENIIIKQNHKTSYNRVISLAPSFSETMKSLGLVNKLVGVTINCEDKEFEKISKIGSFAQINLEAILALNPDLVLAVPHALVTPILQKLSQHNIEIFAQQPDTLEDIKNITLTLAKKFMTETKGKKIINDIDNALDTIKYEFKNFQDKDKNKFIFAVSASPLVIAGKNSFSSQILEKTGLNNIASNNSLAWPIWSIEQIILNPPDIIIFSANQENFFQYQYLVNKIAKKNPHIKIITPKKYLFSSPSPKIINDIDTFKKLIIKEYNRAI